jgi:hypothetical protein
MPVRGGKRREYRPVWYGMSDWPANQSHSLGNPETLLGPPGDNNNNLVMGNYSAAPGQGSTNTIVGYQNVLAMDRSGNSCFGNFTTVDGYANVVIGNFNTLSGVVSANIGLGHDNLIQSSGHIFIGQSITMGPFSSGHIFIGSSLSSPGMNSQHICIGYANSIADSCSYHTSIGVFNTIGKYSGQNTALGSFISIGENLSNTLAIGDRLNVGQYSSLCVVIGHQTDVVRGSSNTAIGQYCHVAQQAYQDVCIGYELVLGEGAAQAICIGRGTAIHNGTGADIAIGRNSTINPQSSGNVVIGYSQTIGYATFATFSMIVPDLADLANNDWVSLPNGIGGYMEVEFQVDGSFVPYGPPRYVCDVQAAANSTDVGHALVNTWNTTAYPLDMFPIDSESVGGDGRWTGNFHYPEPGAIGNGWNVTPTVVSGLFTGSTSSGGTQISSSECVNLGGGSTIHGAHGQEILIGHFSTFGTPASSDTSGQGNILIGRQSTMAITVGIIDSIGIGSGTHTEGSYSVVLGGAANLGVGSDSSLAIGPNALVSTQSPNSMAVGPGVIIGTTCTGCMVMGGTPGGNESEVNDTSNYCMAIGPCAFVGTGCTASLAFGGVPGFGLCLIQDDASNGIAMGQAAMIGFRGESDIAIGHGAIVVADCSYSIAFGNGAYVQGSSAVALGDLATSTANQFTVGNSDIVGAGRDCSIHYFAVRGNNGGVLDTIAANDSPADQCFGLSLVWNNAGAYSNKTVKGAVSPPLNSILLYVDP